MKPQEPPAKKTNNVHPHQEWADGMRVQPGREFCLNDDTPLGYDAAARLAYHINKGILAAYRPKGAFTATARRGYVYGRYNVTYPDTERVSTKHSFDNPERIETVPQDTERVSSDPEHD